MSHDAPSWVPRARVSPLDVWTEWEERSGRPAVCYYVARQWGVSPSEVLLWPLVEVFDAYHAGLIDGLIDALNSPEPIKAR